MWLYEKTAREQGFEVICGVDEAGRGPLAGDVYAAAVILPFGFEINGLTDSKKLSEKKRDLLAPVIKKNALAYCVSAANVDEIDRLNILNATLLAMNRAIAGIGTKIDIALVDGKHGKEKINYKSEFIIKGDFFSANIAAASILAKTERDKYMLELDKIYPQYKFSGHKGYGTKQHYELIEKYGISPAHRKTFLKNVLLGG